MRLVTAAFIFLASCWGMGYFVGRKLRSLLAIGLASGGAAIVWPVLLIALVVHDGRQYQPHGPSDPVEDAPALLLMSALFVGVPILFVISLLLVSVGIVVARKKRLAGNPAEQ